MTTSKGWPQRARRRLRSLALASAAVATASCELLPSFGTAPRGVCEVVGEAGATLEIEATAEVGPARSVHVDDSVASVTTAQRLAIASLDRP